MSADRVNEGDSSLGEHHDVDENDVSFDEELAVVNTSLEVPVIKPENQQQQDDNNKREGSESSTTASQPYSSPATIQQPQSGKAGSTSSATTPPFKVHFSTIQDEFPSSSQVDERHILERSKSDPPSNPLLQQMANYSQKIKKTPQKTPPKVRKVTGGRAFVRRQHSSEGDLDRMAESLQNSFEATSKQKNHRKMNTLLNADNEENNIQLQTSSSSLDPPLQRYSSSAMMTLEDIEICQRLDEEYERALEEREIGYNARFHSVRQSAFLSVFFMFSYLALGTAFFMRQANWSVPNSLLFSIYTITTVGYGNQIIPRTAGFQAYTIFYILVGIAALTIMVRLMCCAFCSVIGKLYGRPCSHLFSFFIFRF
jgi:hypothetical protein